MSETQDSPEKKVDPLDSKPASSHTDEEILGGSVNKWNPLNWFKKDSPERWVKEGESLTENRNYAQATMAFQKALEIDATSYGAYKGLGNVFVKKGGRSNFEVALKNYREAISLNPYDGSLYTLTARLCEKMGRLKEATLERKKMVIVKTLQQQPKNHIANSNMGILLLQQGRVKDGLIYFQKSVEVNPSFDVGYRNIAATYYKIAFNEEGAAKKDAVSKGLAVIEKGLNIKNSPNALVIKGKLLEQGERFDDALAICDEVLEVDSINKEAFVLKRRILEKTNRLKEAEQALDTFQSQS